MSPARKLQISDQSTLLGPGATTIRPLVDGVRQGHSIHALAETTPSIRTQPALEQQIFCQTSGSSGQPKVIRRDPISWIRSFDLTAQRFGVGPQDCYAILGGLGHSLTLFALFEALHIGADIVCLSGQRPARQMEGLQTHKVTVLYATPTQLRLLLASSQGGLPDLRLIFVGGGMLDKALRAALKTRFGAALHEFFGASETSFITMTDDNTPEGSVGRAYPGVTLRIGDDLPAMQTGEIWVRSPYLFTGYATGHSDDTRWQGDYLSIGELGFLDIDGNLFLRGRKSRMVTVADKNVFPEEIETLLTRHPAIAHIAVLTHPDPQRGHVIEAVIQPSKDANISGLEASVRKICKQAIGAASVPRRIRLIEKMPLLPAGKPDLQTLQQKPQDTGDRTA
jgi:long-chain acyl-CoA synthetase